MTNLESVPHKLPFLPVTEHWDWQLQGECRSKSPESFFHPTGERGAEKAKRDEIAKAICRQCPVIQECLDHSLGLPEPYGVWGGLTEEERKQLLTQNKTRSHIRARLGQAAAS